MQLFNTLHMFLGLLLVWPPICILYMIINFIKYYKINKCILCWKNKKGMEEGEKVRIEMCLHMYQSFTMNVIIMYCTNALTKVKNRRKNFKGEKNI